jgi:hypothetical protein
MDVKGAPRSPKREKGCALRRAAGCDRWCGVPLCAVWVRTCGVRGRRVPCGRRRIGWLRRVRLSRGACGVPCGAVRAAPVSALCLARLRAGSVPLPVPVRSSAAARSRARRFWSTLGRMRLFSFTYSVDACANDSSRPTRPECWHPDRPRRHRCRCRCR